MGGLDLVGPEGVVIRQLPETVFVFRREFGPVLAHSPQQGLVILLKQASGRRQRQFFFPRPPQKAPQLPVPGKKSATAHGKENQSKHQAQCPGIGHCLHRQIIKTEHRREDANGAAEQQRGLILALQV